MVYGGRDPVYPDQYPNSARSRIVSLISPYYLLVEANIKARLKGKGYAEVPIIREGWGLMAGMFR